MKEFSFPISNINTQDKHLVSTCRVKPTLSLNLVKQFLVQQHTKKEQKREKEIELKQGKKVGKKKNIDHKQDVNHGLQ